MGSSNKFLVFSLAVLAAGILILPSLALAQGLVPCGGPGQESCRVCHLYELARKVINFLLFTLAIPLMVVALIAGGVIWLTSAGSEEKVAFGKRILWSAVIGFLIAFAAWVIVNTILDTLVFSYPTYGGEWFNYGFCAAFDDLSKLPPPGPPGPPPPTGDACNDPAKLAQQHGNAAGQRDAPELTALINCIVNHPKVKGKSVGEISTFDKSHSICNLTRGDGHCDANCSHMRDSCHYGGRTGTTGARAVDFGNQKIGNDIIEAAIACGAKLPARCETNNGAAVPCTDSRASHVHVNTKTCDSN